MKVLLLDEKMFKKNLPVIPLSNMIFTISSRSTLRPPTGAEECQIEMETYHNNSRIIIEVIWLLQIS